MQFQDFRNEAFPRPAFDMHKNLDGVGYVRLDCAKAKVNPETTMATKERPRAMVVVKACCRTLAAFSQGEFACARAADTRNRVMKRANSGRTKIPRRNRENFADTSSSRIEIWSETRRLAAACGQKLQGGQGLRRVRRYLGHPGRNRRSDSCRVSMQDRSLFIYSAPETENVSPRAKNIFASLHDTLMKNCRQEVHLEFPRGFGPPGFVAAMRRSFAKRRFTRCRKAFGVRPSSS